MHEGQHTFLTHSPRMLHRIFGYQEDAAADVMPFPWLGRARLSDLRHLLVSWYSPHPRQELPILDENAINQVNVMDVATDLHHKCATAPLGPGPFMRIMSI